jgi:riboflavin kinase/FMN adenylyltransferase
MKIIQDKDLPIKEETVCTIGSFDGFHIGHKKILKKVKEKALKTNRKSLVITFDPHPKKLLNPDKAPCTITDTETKKDLLKKEGIDFLYIIKFDENFSKKTAKEFLKFLVNDLNCKHIIVGYDWKFGYKKEGNVYFAEKYEKELGFNIEIVEPILQDDIRVSSTLIRKLLKEGEIEKASYFLGRNYCIKGKVVEGNKLGRKIGFPTINIKPPENLCLRKGVYAGFVEIEGKTYPAVINYGYRPTVDGKKLLIEAHIFDKEIKLKNQFVKVFFVSFIREEKKFESVGNLQKQIAEDIKKAKEILEVIV